MEKGKRELKDHNQKTIAIVINTSWNIFNFRLTLMKSLREKGYRVVAIAPRDKYSEKIEQEGFEYHNINMNNKGTNPVEDTRLVYAFYKLYKEIEPDVILQYTIKPNIYGSIAAGMLGIPVISTITGLGTVFLKDSFSSKVAKFLYKVALKVPKKVFYQNAHDRELFIESNLVKEEKTDLLHGSGIDTERFKPSETKKEKKETLQFLFIARLVKDKGIVEYVRAAEIVQNSDHQSLITNHPKIEFCILGPFYPGNPTAISEDQMKIWEEEGAVKYLGESDDVMSVINEADCIVLPSYREGLSRVLLEAASMAKPIITTDVPGCREVVDDGVNGYLCEVKDVDSLAMQMEKMLLLSDDERREMGRKGREKVLNEFDGELVIRKYLDTIDELLLSGN